MDNQNIGKISMKTGNRPRAKFNMKSDTTTTASFGECQPVLVRQCQPNTKSVLSHSSLVRVVPLAAPVRARMGLRLLSKFVGISELSDNFEAFRTRQAVTRGTKRFVPNNVPHIKLGILSAMCLVGAKFTLYRGAASSEVPDMYTMTADKLSSLSSLLPESVFNAYKALMGVNNNTPQNSISNALFDIVRSYASGGYSESWDLPIDDDVDAPLVNIGRLLGWSHAFWIPCANVGGIGSFMAASDDAASPWPWVDARAADLVFPYVVTNSGSTSQGWVAVRLSSFGQRLRKVLIGCGYQLDVLSSKKVSLFPLMAFYKAYFDSFGLMLYENWENNPLFRLMRHSDDNNAVDFSAFIDTNPSSDSVPCRWLIEWISRLGLMFFTDEQDYISMHTRTMSVTGQGLGDSFGTGVVANSPTVGLHVTSNDDTSSESSNVSMTSGHAYIQGDQPFSNLDIEVLRKAYQCTNRDTIAGKRIAEALIARGFGDYVRECKSRFIGVSYVNINVDDVDVTANGYDDATGQGAVAGEYTGKGMGYDDSPSFTYVNNEYGYIITIACVIPDSGYVQQIDPQVEAIERGDFYQGDYDGVGPEVITKRDVCGQNDFVLNAVDSLRLDDSFGFAPRESKHKVPFSRLNGDFSRMSSRDKYLPYNLDKYIPMGDKRIVEASSSDSVLTLNCYDTLTPARLPLATPSYRYIGRVPWLGFLGRIFNWFGQLPTYDFEGDDTIGLNRHWEYTYDVDDGFMLFVFNDLNQYAPMLPIEDSFETTEDGNDGNTDTSISKA